MLLTTDAATKMAGYQNADGLRQLIRDGRLPGQKLGGRMFVEYDDVISYMEGSCGRGRPRGPQK